jgi:hypothetical protein
VLLLVILLMAVFTVYSVLRTPSFQVLAGRLASGFLSRQFHNEIYLDKLRITESLYIDLQGLRVVDDHKNTMLKVDDLRVKLSGLSLKDHWIDFENVSLDSGGLYLHQYEGDTLMNLDLFLKGFSPDTTIIKDTVPAKDWNFYCENLLVNDFSFGLKQEPCDTSSDMINFNDLLINGIFVDLKEISINGDSIQAYIEHIACQEKTGLELLNLSGDAIVSQSGIRLHGGQISTGQTSLDLDLDFLYNGYDKLSYFLDSVRIVANFRSSLITLSDVGYFARELFNMDDPVMITGQVAGAISDFSAQDLSIKLGEFTEFDGDIAMKGLPDIDSTFFDLTIDSFTTTPEDIATFDLPIEGKNIPLPDGMQELGITGITGTFKGFLTNFNTDLVVKSDAGDLKIQGEMAQDSSGGNLLFSGNLLANSFHIGDLLNSDDLGTIDCELEFDGQGSTVADLDVEANGWIQNLVFKGHSYDKIVYGGRVKGKSFDGKLMVMDSALTLGYTGLVDLNGPLPVFDFNVDIEHAQLYRMHLLDRSEDATIKAGITGKFKGLNVDSSYGKLTIKNLLYLENGKYYKLDNLDLMRKKLANHSDSLRLRSDYIDADMSGNFTIIALVNQMIRFVLGKNDDPAVAKEMIDNPQVMTYEFRIKDLSPVTELFLPDIKVSPGIVINGHFDSRAPELELKGSVDQVDADGIKIKGINFSGITVLDEFNFDISTKKIILQENDDGTYLGLDNLVAHLSSADSLLNYSIQWDNDLVTNPNKGALDGFVKFRSMDNFEAGIMNAEANFGGNMWRVENGNLITIDSTAIGIRNFKIDKGEESFMVDGSLSSRSSDTLNLFFDEWELQNFNPFLENISLSLQGIINGKFGVFRNDGKLNLFANITVNDLNINDVYFGDAELKTHWLDADNALALDLNIYSKGTQENPYKILGVNGIYYPFDKKRNFDFTINAQNLNISVLEPLLSSFSSHVNGYATGKLTLRGTNAAPVLLGKLKLQRAEMKVDYLNVTYSFSNEVVFKEDMIEFNDLKVYDPKSNTAMLNGGIRHNHFNNMSLDLTIEPVNFMALNLDRYQNEVFYGTAYASGTVRLEGPFENLAIIVDAKTEKGTKVSIPINYSVDVSQNDFIVFTNLSDTAKKEHEGEVQIVGVSIDISTNVTNDADIEISLPGNIGNLKAKGNGKLRLGVDPNGYLTLSGSYVIQTGLFVFSLEQLVSRRFDILEGSKISWNGDINDAEVSIVARYRLRTDLSGLGISLIDPEASSQKVIVNTDIRMTGNLFNPDLNFGITFPNLQEQTKQAVYAVLDTNDKGLMNQQAISLLVLGSFSSTGTSGINPVNPAVIVSNTLSSMLSQISNDFNIGINYVPGDQVSAEQLEVALSTQLLDDRLIIDGNIDVTGANANTQKTSSIVGDINAEYKLTPDGRFRVKAFNRSNDLSLFNDYAPYTQGVGIFYRKDFNNIHELFRKAGSEPGKKKSGK